MRILVGSALALLPTLKAGSVQMCVTSPPYWGLRDYGHAQQIGGERTYPEYVENIRAVFGEVHRVLRDDGVLWLNLGDSYATGGGAVGRAPGGGDQGARFIRQGMINTQPNRMPQPDLKPKDLVGIPWRVAFALQADGWYLRSDIIWHKPNPMPESVTDRPTKAHEYLFLLAKSERYYYDAAAITEECVGADEANDFVRPERISHGAGSVRPYKSSGQRNRRSVWTVGTQPYSGAHFATFPPALIEPCIHAGSRSGDTVLDPFGGAGTTGLVASRLSRNALLIELNPEYAAMAERRIHDDNPLFSDIVA